MNQVDEPISAPDSIPPDAEKAKGRPNVNLKRLLDNLQDYQEALILNAQRDEIINNRELYDGDFSFKQDSSGLYLVSRLKSE